MTSAEFPTHIYPSASAPAGEPLLLVRITVPTGGGGTTVEHYHFLPLPEVREGAVALDVSTRDGALLIEGKHGTLVKAPGTWLEVRA